MFHYIIFCCIMTIKLLDLEKLLGIFFFYYRTLLKCSMRPESLVDIATVTMWCGSVEYESKDKAFNCPSKLRGLFLNHISCTYPLSFGAVTSNNKQSVLLIKYYFELNSASCTMQKINVLNKSR